MGEDGRVPWGSPTLYLVVLVAAMGPLDMPPIGPALPAIQARFGVSAASAGLVTTAFAVPGVVLAPVLGGLADRYGRRRVLVPCLTLFGLAGLGVLVVDSFRALLALRFVQGSTGGSILSSLGLTIAGDRYRGAQRNAVIGATSAAISVVAGIGPAVGGALATVSWRAPFALYGVCLPVALLVALYLPDADVETAMALDAAYLRDAVASLPVRAVLGVYGAVFLGFTLFFGAVLTAVPFLLDQRYGLGSGRVGLLLTAALLVTVVVALANGRLARRLSSVELIAAGIVAYGVGVLAVGLAGSPAAVLAGLTVFGVGHGLVLPSIGAALSEFAPARFRAGVLSLRTSLILSAAAVGPPLFTLPAAALGYGSLLVGGGVVALAVGVVATLAVRSNW